MANYNYIRENDKAFRLMLLLVIDESSASNWRDIEHINEFKTGVLHDYIMFLQDMNQLDINANNVLYEQSQYSKTLFRICDNFKRDGVIAFKGNPDIILDTLKSNIIDWFQNDRDLELKRQEKQFYTKIAFAFKDDVNVSSQYNGRLAQLKEEVLKTKKNNLG
jgi:hypothetical protein